MEKDFDKVEVYKKWFRTSDKQGFCSISGWFEASKVVIDIGEVTDSATSTKCYVDAFDFLVWADSVYIDQAERLFPENKKKQFETPESFVSFGGSGDVARVFKAHWWKDDDKYSGFAFKCGHFKGTKTNSGAIMPDFKNVLSVHMIKMSRLEVATIAKRLQTALVCWSAENEGTKQLFKPS